MSDFRKTARLIHKTRDTSYMAEDHRRTKKLLTRTWNRNPGRFFLLSDQFILSFIQKNKKPKVILKKRKRRRLFIL